MAACNGTGTYRPLLRPCPLCGATEGRLIEELHFRVFDDSAISGGCALVVCPACGFAFNDTPSTQADFDRYYRQNSYYCTATTAGTGGSGASDTKRFEDLYERVSALIPHKSAAVFDVGCAKGGLLSLLARRGYTNLYGVEMLPECITYVRETVGVHAAAGSALELPFPGVRADVLIYSHVVEHVIDLPVLVAAAGGKLAAGGLVYVEVPDASRYGEHTGNPYQDLYLEHVNHFDSSSLADLFSCGGFEVLTSGRIQIEAPPAGKVPCVWAVFRKGGASRVATGAGLDQRLRDYLAWSGGHSAHARFAALAGAQTPLYLWGISQYAMLLLGQTPLCGADIRGFIDKDPSKRMRMLMGLPVNPPEYLRHAGPASAVLVTASGYEVAIANELKIMGFRGTLLTASGEAMSSSSEECVTGAARPAAMEQNRSRTR